MGYFWSPNESYTVISVYIKHPILSKEQVWVKFG